MSERSIVELPPEVGEPFEVFLNGVPQRAGRDFRVEGRQLVFERRLAREGRLGFWRWLSLFLGIAGTYRQNDSVDVVYDAGGRRAVTSLPIESPRTRSPSWPPGRVPSRLRAHSPCRRTRPRRGRGAASAGSGAVTSAASGRRSGRRCGS